MSNGAASLNVDGADVNLTPNPAGRASVGGNAEITGSLIIRESDGVTVQKGNGNAIGSIYHSGSSTFDISAVDVLKLSSDDDINMVPAAGNKVSVVGGISASLGITGSQVHTTEVYATTFNEVCRKSRNASWIGSRKCF